MAENRQERPKNDEVIKTDKILLHICCGPCSLHVIDDLRDLFGDIEIHGLYANPNIHPFDEFQRRRENAIIAAGYKKITIDCLDDFQQECWENFEGTQKERCLMCYRKRMNIAAEYAAEHGYGVFTTSLTVSPYQDHKKILEAGREAAERFGVKFFYWDYSVNFREGQREAREIGLYRQKYCGCLPSKEYK
ncbi:MAG: epoxyqueuosine reductase QueH [Clostridia bacterium]|nr:epoxyqueuosine reductase QueH [Clostridia bacterium]